MNKIVFIVPYYGHFPAYFQEWVYSAEYLAKQNIDFLLITDIHIPFKLPSNFKVKNISFEQLKAAIQAKFDFKISLPTPYNLCDFKPALGYVFEKDIQEYQFWGNCDIDQVWGNVREFITEEVLNNHDRIQFLGHFILYRNRKDINELFKLPGAIYDYKKVYSSPIHYSFCEHSGMMRIVEENNISNYIKTNYADLSTYYKRMIVNGVDNYKYQLIYWYNGDVIRAYIDGNKVKTDKFMYFHFQKKNPKTINAYETNPVAFYYTADGFMEFNPNDISKEYIIKHCDYVSDEQDELQKKQYMKSQLKKFFTISWELKIIWIKQRIATRKTYMDKRYF